MSEKTTHILKIVGGWIAFFAVTGLLIAAPNFYLLAKSGSWNGHQAVCSGVGAEAKTAAPKEVALRSDFWNFQSVAVSGKLLYAENRETFYLRDGIFSIALNLSHCQNLDGFEREEMPASARGTVGVYGGEIYLNVTELREIAPGFFQILLNSGYMGLNVAVVVLIVIGIARFLRWVLTAIGLKKPDVPLSPEEAGNKAAGKMLLASIGIPLTWFMNPFFGAGLHAFNVFHNRIGLQSSKRKVAIAAVILSAAGFMLMFIVGFASGAFEDPNKSLNVYADIEGAKTAALTGAELLEFAPYVNNDFYFSVHQPKSWVVDEKKIKTDGLLTFEGPEDSVFQGKPFRPKFNISFIPIQAFGVKNGAEAMEAFRAGAAKSEGISIIADDDRVLAGGRMNAVLLEATEPHEEGYKRHVLALIVPENDILYIVGAAIPEEKWNDHYAQVIRASFRAFEAWRATFVACLKGKGAVLYSAFDCPHCETQKEIFTEGVERLPYVECQQGIDDSSETDVCRDKNITAYPTWEFADGSRLIGVQTLKALGDKTGCKML